MWKWLAALLTVLLPSITAAGELNAVAVGISLAQVEMRNERGRMRRGTALPDMSFERGSDVGLFIGAGVGFTTNLSNNDFRGDLYIKFEPLAHARLSPYALATVGGMLLTHTCSPTRVYDGTGDGNYVERRECEVENVSGGGLGGGVRFRYLPKTHAFLQYTATTGNSGEVIRSVLAGLSVRGP